MKRVLFCILLLAGLTACRTNVAASSAGGRCNDNLCIKLTAKEPITVSEPIIVTIKITSQKNIPDLKLYLGSNDPTKRVSIEDTDLPGWKKGGFVNWPVNIKAKQTLTFTRKILLPAEDGLYPIIAEAFLSEGFVVGDVLQVHVTKGSAKVYFANTPIPTVFVTEPASALGPSPTLETATPSYP